MESEIVTVNKLFEYCIKEYNSRNYIVRKLINNFYNKLRQQIKIIHEDTSFLEIGCGVAESSKRIDSFLQGKQFEVSEYDDGYIKKLEELNLPFKISKESVYELQRYDDSFDCLFLLEVLEHLEYPENAIRELHRVTKKHLIISVPNEPVWRISNMLRGKYLSDFGNTPGHINHYNVNSLTRLLKPYFIVMQICKPYPWIIFLAAKK